MRGFPAATAMFFIFALAACGGGGSSDSGTEPVGASTSAAPSPVNAEAAWGSLLTVARSWNVTGTGSDGKAYSLAYSLTPTGTGTGNGMPANIVKVSSTLKQGSTVAATSSEELFVKPGTTTLIGITAPPNSCGVINDGSSPPASASIGQSGPLYTSTLIPGCSLSYPYSDNFTATWSIEAEGSTTYLCENITDQEAVITSTQQLCVQVNAAGTIGAAARVSINNGTGLTLVMH